MRLIAAGFAALVSLPALAATLNWTHPTSYDDNSVLVVADIASTRIEWSNTSPFGTVAGTQVVTGTANTVALPDPPAGTTRCYRAATTVVAAKGGQTSVPSNVACVTKPFPAPRPPTLIEAILAWIKGFFGRFV